MKKIIICVSALILMNSCVEKKNPTIEKVIVTKTDSIEVATILSFEEELLSKSKLPDTLAMAAYRTSGLFIGVDEFKDSIEVQIDVEAQKVTGTLTQQMKGIAVDSVFEGKLKNNIIFPIKGLNKNSTLTISGNDLTLIRGTKKVVLTLK